TTDDQQAVTALAVELALCDAADAGAPCFSIAAMRTRQVLLHAIVWPVLALLAACASAPPGSVQAPGTGAAPSAERDGAEASPPADLASVADAEPRVETIRTGGPNNPYE